MSEAFINVTEGSGKKAHTNQRTIGANDVQDEYVVTGRPVLRVLHRRIADSISARRRTPISSRSWPARP